MVQDIYFAVRMLRKQPGSAALAILTLALGIGATSAVFSLVEGVLLTPPPYRQPDRLVLIPPARTDGQALSPEHAPGWAAAQWTEWPQRAQSLDGIAAYGWTFNFLVQSDGSQSMEGMWVSRDYFRVLGLEPLLGRTFLDSETGATAKPVIVLGYDLWQRAFHGDPRILGKTIRISRWETPPTVIGVMPPGVRFLPSPGASQEPNYDLNATVDFWIPARQDPARQKDRNWDVVARLRHGVALSQAQAELQLVAARQAANDRDFEGFTPRLDSLAAVLNRDGRRILLPLLAAAALILLIACGNVAALLLVRGFERQRAYAVRSALGVSRLALLRQVSTEALLLALAGAALGMALAFGIVRLFKLMGGNAIPRLDAVAAGWPLLACGVGAALLAALLAGIFPALRASRLDPVAVLKSAGPKASVGRGERRLLHSVTMIQTALTMALLVGAGLLVRTMINLARVPSGYQTSHILTMSVTAVQGDWSAFHVRALELVSALPGVRQAAFAWGVPLTGNDWPGRIEVEGLPAPRTPADRIAIPIRSVTPGYFGLLAQPVLEGRDFRSTDKRGAPDVAIVNQAFVDRYFPGRSPIGKRIWGQGRQRPANQIVGVVANSRNDDLSHAAEPEIYLCLWQAGAFSKSLVVRTAADPRSVMTAVQRELRAIDPTVAVENVRTLDQIRDRSLASRTFAMRLLLGFSLLGSILTLVGIYGVLALSVASRRREIAIRTAVGAERRHIRGLVFGEGFRLIAGGFGLGVGAALLLSRVLSTFLFGVGSADPVTFLAVGLAFGAAALLACWAPVRRATAVDPIEALRYE